MVVKFESSLGHSKTADFQNWRNRNPNGFYLTQKTKKKFNLHRVACKHQGGEYYTGPEDMTREPKICSPSMDELYKWAAERTVDIHECKDCIVLNKYSSAHSDTHQYMSDLASRSDNMEDACPPEYFEYLEHITDDQVRSAFELLVSQFIASRKYKLKVLNKGPIKNFHFIDSHNRNSYSVILNKKSLLFYIRKPSAIHPGLNLNSLQKTFPSANANNSGEYTIRILSKDDTTSILTFIGIAQARDQIGVYSPDEIHSDSNNYYEGAKHTIIVNAYERNSEARKACIEHYGYRCSVCGISFEEHYGNFGRNYIHVHHLVPLSSIGEKYIVDPIADLRPICPNCHVVIHMTDPPMDVDSLRMELQKRLADK